MIGGGNAMAVAVLVATLWTLMPLRTPGIAPAVRRSLAITLLLLLGAQLLACLPGDTVLRATPLALAGAALVGSIVGAALPPNLPRAVTRGLAGLAIAAALVVGAATYQVAQEDPIGFAADHRERQAPVFGVSLALPRSFAPVSAAGQRQHPLLPVFQGWIDTQALRGGALVQALVIEGGPMPGGSALFRIDAGLQRELVVREDAAIPEAARAVLDSAMTGWSLYLPGEAPAWKTYTLQRNGEAVARVIERAFGAVGPTVLLVVAPASAHEQAPGLYAQIVADASRGP
jgi:hypothetical protein